MEVNFYEQMSAETKIALDHLVSTLPWHQTGEVDPFLGDLQIHMVSQLEKVVLDTMEDHKLAVEGKTALQYMKENM